MEAFAGEQPSLVLVVQRGGVLHSDRGGRFAYERGSDAGAGNHGFRALEERDSRPRRSVLDQPTIPAGTDPRALLFLSSTTMPVRVGESSAARKLGFLYNLRCAF